MLTSFFKKVYTWILSYDYLGPYPELNHRGSERYSTILGVILTLLSYAVAIWSIIEDFTNMINNENPSIVTGIQASEANISFNYNDLQSSGIYIQVLYLDLWKQALFPLSSNEIPKFMIYKNRIANNTYIKEHPTGKDDFTYLINCPVSWFNRYNDYVSDTFKLDQPELNALADTSLCFPEDFNETISATKGGAVGFGVMLYFKDIYPILASKQSPMQIRINYLETIIDPNKSNAPFKKLWTSKYIPVIVNESHEYRLTFQLFTGSYDKTKFIVPLEGDTNTETHKTLVDILDFQSLPNNHEIPEGDVVAWINFQKDTKETSAKLRYVSFDSIVGNFGGTIGVLFPFFEILLYYLVCPFYHSSRLNSVFLFHENLENKDEINNYITETLTKLQKVSSKNNGADQCIRTKNATMTLTHSNSKKSLSKTANNSNEVLVSSIEIDENKQYEEAVLNSSEHHVANVNDKVEIDGLKSDNDARFFERSESKSKSNGVNQCSRDVELSSLNWKDSNTSPTESKLEVLENFRLAIRNKKIRYADAFNYVRYLWCCSQNEIYGRCLETLDAILDEDSLAKDNLKLKLLIRMFLNKKYPYTYKLFKFPSFNIKDEDAVHSAFDYFGELCIEERLMEEGLEVEEGEKSALEYLEEMDFSKPSNKELFQVYARSNL